MRRCKSSDEQISHAKERRVPNDSILGLPEHIIISILSRLPIETIFNCKSVCETFNDFLKDPTFAQVHLSQASINNSNRGFLIQNIDKPSDNFLYFDMIDLEKRSCPWVFDCPMTTDSQGFQRKDVFSSILLGSCNGLILLTYQISPPSMRFCVCNPVLGEFVVLPPPWDFKTDSICLGFSPKTKKYKVIKFSYDLLIDTKIHTLGTNYWRKMDYVPHPMPCKTFLDCSFLNGNLPFLTEGSEVSHMICSFNFETEQYSYIHPPTHFFSEETRKSISCENVWLLGGLFCISYMLDKSYLEVFVMKNYGVDESWTKEFTIDMNFVSTRGPTHLFSSTDTIRIHGITLLNNGDMVIRYPYFRLLYYSLKKGTMIDLLHLSREENERDRLHGVYYTTDIYPSLISLKDIVGESVGVVQRSKLHIH